MSEEFCLWKHTPFSTPYTDRMGKHPGWNDEHLLGCKPGATVRIVVSVDLTSCPYCGKPIAYREADPT